MDIKCIFRFYPNGLSLYNVKYTERKYIFVLLYSFGDLFAMKCCEIHQM